MAKRRDDMLDVAAAALRDVPNASPSEIKTTRRRVLASLEQRRAGARRRITVVAVLATLGTGTLSWAAATGRIDRVLVELGVRAAPAPALPAPAVAPVEERRAHPTGASTAVAAVEVPPPIPEPEVAPVDVAPPPVRVIEHHRPRPRVDDAVERGLYRRAHDIHFRAHDPDAALAAWDAYLAQRPTGRFAIEARYNRAIVLVRLRRLDEARAELTPFAAGAVAPGGYRQREARALIDAIDQAEP